MIASTVRAFFGRGKRPALNLDLQTGTILFLHGRGDFLLDVSRVSKHQAEIRALVGSRLEPWYRFETLATLLPDGGSAEPKAVAVEIDGRVIGYLPGHLATRFREWLESWHLSLFCVRCKCMVINWAGGEGEAARYTVKLDIEQPFKMTLS